MAFDPRQEDYQRLGLRFARSLDTSDAASAAKAFATFGRRFAQNRDSLPQSDADRAFHLVTRATDLIDYKLPFATPDQADKLIAKGQALLNEAISLDPYCHDAIRMSAAGKEPSFEHYLRFLIEMEPEVEKKCKSLYESELDDSVQERISLGSSIALKPYFRWLASIAGLALICGKNRLCLNYGEKLLSLDANDESDTRFTLALALAKLEDEPALDKLEKLYAGSSSNAWFLLAHIACAHKECDYSRARTLIKKMRARYPGAVESLIIQSELPDGVYSRLVVQPYSEDELILAISEGTVLLQEGCEIEGRAALGQWLAEEAATVDPLAAERALREQQHVNEEDY